MMDQATERLLPEPETVMNGQDSIAVTRRWPAERDGSGGRGNWVQKARESYFLQLTLAARLTSQAFMAEEGMRLWESPLEVCGIGADVDSVSYRLWVNGCLSFSDKISDGFYNIMGMDPYLWGACNESGDRCRLPSLSALRDIDPAESSMEVVLGAVIP
ncbi:Serine/threonine-protein kinase CTR1 [Acorus calamus]|uniref:Serine/threonine-protein kinase CTR1 n=1 Tax=Acorus calamus TaxID=4465 RepID=A0AAV9FBR4_ACOCL|nr:Serine/threonine-protein kinase CTR1 [Acorus calamus]